MPLCKIDFQTAFIYKIECRDPVIVDKYYGSSCGIEAKRRNKHKSDCTNSKSKKYNLHLYQFIRDHGGWTNWVFIKIKMYPCANKIELHIEEQKYILMNDHSLNIRRSHITEQELKEQNKDRMKKYHNNNKDKSKIYHNNNKEHIIEYQKNYYQLQKLKKLQNLIEKPILIEEQNE